MSHKEDLGHDFSVFDLERMFRKFAYEGITAEDLKFINEDSSSEYLRVVARLIRCVGGVPDSVIKKINNILSEAGMELGQIKSLLRHRGWQVVHVGTTIHKEYDTYKIEAYKKIGLAPKAEHYRINIFTTMPSAKGFNAFRMVKVELKKGRKIRTAPSINEISLIESLNNPARLFEKIL